MCECVRAQSSADSQVLTNGCHHADSSRGAELVGDIQRPRRCNWTGAAHALEYTKKRVEKIITLHTLRITQVELLRAKLEQANNKNDLLRENYEMLDTKLTQVIVVYIFMISAMISINTTS